MSFGIALSGGGAKGAAHVGVLMALYENNLIPSSISGTSMGAIVAGLYSLGYLPDELHKLIKKFSKEYNFFIDPTYSSYFKAISQIFSRSTFTLSGFIKGDKIEKYFKKITQNKDISEIKIPIVIPCVDLLSGKTIAYTNNLSLTKPLPNIIWKDSGKLYEIMRASSSLPAIFYPKKMNNHLLVDGGITNVVPINLLKAMGTKKIIAVDISQEYKKPKNTNILEVTMHSFEIMQRELKKYSLGNEIFLITPELPDDAEILDFKNMSKFVNAGYISTKKIMPQIIKALKK